MADIDASTPVSLISEDAESFRNYYDASNELTDRVR